MIRAYVGTFLSLAGLACGLTWLYLGMRSVMEVGGACADGGPYVSAQPCPEGVPLAMLGGIFGGLICLGLFLWFASRLGGGYAGLAAFAWPALFLSLGWNFLEFGLDPPGEESGPVWGWLVCAVLFFLMGGLPLLALASPKALRAMLWPPDPDPFASVSRSAAAGVPLGSSLIGRSVVGAVAGGSSSASGPSTASPPPRPTPPSVAPDAGEEVVAQLERLAALRDRG